MLKYGALHNTGYAHWASQQRKEFRKGYQAACQGVPLDPKQCHYWQRGYWIATQDLARR